ncbi:hypothetical protein PtA15_3A446 [Puccinia triticina]|uniref:Uncharacterized protein n=1 Tax=Puccinia triticina TaxID=208348 RepID=A0ABY7CEE9_9BASI|nr:uncharacterized protein PtA15_3A446 [Puccinia triticina]WAQ83079.1 hypothetical protein PtA15_3A446 [Puccinia triticina]
MQLRKSPNPSETVARLPRSISVLKNVEMTQPPKKKICLKTDASTSQSHQLVQHLPDFIQEYVARVQDVNSDGHCGFF